MITLATALMISFGAHAKHVLPEALTLADGQAITNRSEWEQRRRPELLAQFQTHFYGSDLAPTKIESRDVASATLASGVEIRWWQLAFTEIESQPKLDVYEVIPARQKNAVAIVDAETCSAREIWSVLNKNGVSWSELPEPKKCSNPVKNLSAEFDGAIAQNAHLIVFNPGQIFTDDATKFETQIAKWPFENVAAGRPGALIAWSYLYRVVGEQARKRQPAPLRLCAFGFSRLGKAALLAGAFNQNFDAVIAHMSGSLGATPARGNNMETLHRLAKAQPHWTGLALHGDIDVTAEPIDQNELLSLIAPRTLLLADGVLDLWSNPPLARWSAKSASKVWEDLYSLEPIEMIPFTRNSQPASGAKLIHKDFLQIHSLFKNDWDYYFDFVKSL